MNNHQLTKTGSKIASHMLAVIAGLILVMIGMAVPEALTRFPQSILGLLPGLG